MLKESGPWGRGGRSWGLLKEHPRHKFCKRAQTLYQLLYWELSDMNAITRSAGAFLCDPRQLVSLSQTAFLLAKLL